MKEEQVHMNRMFAETARALASAIDPKYAKIMLEMIDEDKEYKMKE